jgi:RNA polymerase sigma-70 factor (ECF subfamily)
MTLRTLHDEHELLAQVAGGDHKAFCILFDRYHGYVFGFGRKLTRSDDQAEEIVQDIFLKIWALREKLSSLDNFEAYLTRLVRNQSYSVLRRNIAHDKASSVFLSQQAEQDNNMERQLAYNETVRILEEAIQGLPEQQRKVYELCHRQGLKYEDAAREMAISADTVHYHMKLALKAIREHFKKHSFVYQVLLAALFSN